MSKEKIVVIGAGSLQNKVVHKRRFGLSRTIYRSGYWLYFW